MGLISGRKEVTTAASGPERLVSTSQWVRSVVITALNDNTNPVAVGDAQTDVAASTQEGLRMAANDTMTIDNIDLYSIYIDVTTDGEGVSYVGTTA